MFETGFLAALLAKLAALGTAAKAAIATTTAAVTLTVAGAATGMLPTPGGGSQPQGGAPDGPVTPVVDSVLETASPSTGAAPDSATTSVASSAGPASVGATADVALPTVPSVPETPPLPDLPDLPELPACVSSIVSSAMTNPDPSAIVSQVSGCVQTVLGSVDLPVDVSRCVASVMQMAAGVAGGDLSGLSNLPQLVSGCLPSGMSIPGMGSIPGIGSIPGFDFSR